MACVHLLHVKVGVTALGVTGSVKAPLCFAIFVAFVAASGTCEVLDDSHESSPAVLVMLTKDTKLNFFKLATLVRFLPFVHHSI